MRPETKKLIEEKAFYDRNGHKVIMTDFVNDIINSEMKSLRDQFAMHAPAIPHFYETKLSQEERLFSWRFYYADQMIKERG